LIKSVEQIPNSRSNLVKYRLFITFSFTDRLILERERKKASKIVKETQEKELVTVESLIQSVLDAVAKETFPESPEGKEAYFMEKVQLGETLCGKGEAFYDESVEYFYKALKVYPAPLELIMIYQKSLPEKVFRVVVNIMALEVGFTIELAIRKSGFNISNISNKNAKQNSMNTSLPKRLVSNLPNLLLKLKSPFGD
jgi:import receptor subunit TOM20